MLGTHSVAYLDLTGSGNETAAHLRASGRLTIMFCAFEAPPMSSIDGLPTGLFDAEDSPEE